MAGEVTIYQQGGILADGELPFDGSSLEVLEGEDLALHGWTTLPPPRFHVQQGPGERFRVINLEDHAAHCRMTSTIIRS